MTLIDVKSLKGITQDSRAVKDGYLFAAFPGKTVDGRDYIADAIRHGASVILAPEGTTLPGDVNPADVILMTEAQPRKIFAHIVAEFYKAQPRIIVAATGTNGKTSVVHFTKALWEAQNLNASSLGTLQGSMTTPGPVHLHAALADLTAAGVTHLAMEASSHGLHQHRLDGVNLSAAGFTNLSRDHLDYHSGMDDYFAAKARLFSEVMQTGTAVINADNEEGQKLIGICEAAGHRVWTYGCAGKDLKLLSIDAKPQGQGIALEVFGKAYEITLPLVGDFQVMNALCALGLVLAEDGTDQDEIITALETLKGAPGRLEYVAGHPQNAAIYVDYAHTPDALEHVLNALRPHTDGKLVCLFGCGGDRDKGKRAVMGEIAARLSDRVIITDDNPRGEDPDVIRAAILGGENTAQDIAKNIEGRRAAIQNAVSNLNKGDVLLIAGKGHEQGQIFADRTDPFDDVTEVKNAIEDL